MTLKRFLYAASFCVAGATLVTWANAADSQGHVEVLRGQVSVQDASGNWVPGAPASTGRWLRAEKATTTLSQNGVIVRLEPGADVKFGPSAQSPTVQARNGRVCFHLDSDVNLQVASGSRTYQASKGEFILDAGNTDEVYVVDGDVRATANSPEGMKSLASQLTGPDKSKPTGSSKWLSSGQVALDGPDVRKRNRNRRRFTQGEENKGKRIGEDLPPTTTPSPTASYTPSPTPSFTPPSPTPTPPPNNTPPPQLSGGEVWPWVVAPLALGGGIFAIVRNNGGDEVVRPISP